MRLQSGSSQDSTLSEGSHSFTARVTDLAGNSATSAAYALTVDLTPPPAPIATLENDTGAPGVASRPENRHPAPVSPATPSPNGHPGA